MEFNNLFGITNSQQTLQIIVKAIAIILSILYIFYSLVLSRQVKEMDEALKDRFNQFLFTINSLQITVSLILLIFAIFLI